MGSGIVFIYALAVFLLIVVPVLAITAFVRVRKIEERPASGSGTSDQIWKLEQRVQGLEKAVERLVTQAAAPTVASASPEQPVSMPSPPRAIPTTAPRPEIAPRGHAPQATETAPHNVSLSYTAPRKGLVAGNVSSLDFENAVGGKWFNYVGILAILFATTFFIKYAFDNNWVGPRGRVGIGLLVGAALVAWSGWLLRRGYKYFSEGIAGLGAAVLYLSLWGGSRYFHIFNSSQAFVGMIAVTAVMVAVALGRDSQRLALLALIGGFLTPELVSTGIDHEIVLFTYTALLSAGMLALERAREWKWLPPLSFFATQVYFWGWYNSFYASEKMGRTLIFAAIFFVLFAILPVMRGMHERRIHDTEYFVAVANVGCFLLALRQMLWPEHRWALTASFLALAGAHLLVLRLFPASVKDKSDKHFLRLQSLFAALALLCVSLAIPARLDHQWLTMAWAIEGAMLVWGGARMASVWLRIAGLFFFGITAVRLIVLSIPAGTFLWNQRFLAFAVAVACFALGCTFVRGLAPRFDELERNAFAALAVAVNVYALIALSLEVWDLLGRTNALGIDGWLAQQLGLSVLWTIYAAALILTGMARHAAMLRWQALALFAVVVTKVFFYDLSILSRFYRIMSFLVLGVLLLGVSFLYQKRAITREGKPR